MRCFARLSSGSAGSFAAFACRAAVGASAPPMAAPLGVWQLRGVASSSTSGAFRRTPLLRQAAAAPSAPKNPYKVLGVGPTATKEEIKKAHRVLARKFHPDAPGGSPEKFLEIQMAYEAVKSGVWIQKNVDGGDAAGGGAQQNRYAGFRYTSASNKSKVSYDEFFAQMHAGKKPSEFDEEEAAAANKKGSKKFGGLSDLHFQAWGRLLKLWIALFTVMRVSFFLMFPRKHQKAPKRQMSDRPRKPPTPKPLMASSAVLP